MYLDEFKLWLEGYLVASGVESAEELEEEQLVEIVTKLSEIKERPIVDLHDPFESRFFHNPWESFGRMLPRFNRYIEKLTYTDTEGNKYEYENRDGEEKVKTNMVTADKLTERARGLVDDAIKKIAG